MLNHPTMLRSILLSLCISPFLCFSQYIHYTDNTVLRKAVASNDRVKSTQVGRLVPIAKATIEIVTVDCPGQSASLPVLNNYVPGELVSKLKTRYMGHLFCMTTMKTKGLPDKYLLKLCVKGQFREAFADGEGNIIE